jgi:hypothetical protein
MIKRKKSLFSGDFAEYTPFGASPKILYCPSFLLKIGILKSSKKSLS